MKFAINHRWLWVTCFVLLLPPWSVRAQPAQIILLRHGEKPDEASSVHLSARGEERAQALATLLGPGSRFTTNAPIASLLATQVTRHDRSHRTSETLAPLGRVLGLPVEPSADSDNYRQLAHRILSDRNWRGKTVVICWTHHDLAQLAGALGVRPTPPAWKEKVYDRLWILNFDHGHPTLSDVPQHLLKGDSKH
ncbi:MAG TPA: histidine phosphatase family protein [Candidatus Saccharimonadales bacterium]|nr:histidine phosphatase family protein [Candidatus Saccharimonadales bacterium]